MAKKQTTQQSKRDRKFFYFSIVSAFAALLVIACLVQVGFIKQYFNTADRLSTLQARTILMEGFTDMKTALPIDAATGDAYIPDARLRIPHQNNVGKLMYSVTPSESNDNKGEVIDVTNKSIVTKKAVPMINAHTIDELNKFVPNVQACARGVSMYYGKVEIKGLQYKQSVALSNGKTLYMYISDSCPELAGTLEMLKNIQSY